MTLDFYFDFISPWAYLASTQLERIATEHHATLRWIPVELDRVKMLTKRVSEPYTPVLMQYVTADLMRWARRYGVPISMPVVVPTSPLLHGFFFAEEQNAVPQYVHRVFQSRWVKGEDLSDEAVLLAIAADCGLNEADFQSATTDPAYAARLEAHCQDAANQAIFGIPTCKVGEEIFWGNDRLDFVAEALAQSR